MAESKSDGVSLPPTLLDTIERGAAGHKAPVVGITGTGESGKNSLLDELIQRQLRDFPQRCIGLRNRRHLESEPLRHDLRIRRRLLA